MKAQHAAEHLYEIVFGSPIALQQEKFLQEGLRSQDPDPVVVISHAEGRVWVGTGSPLDQGLLSDALVPSGLLMTAMVPISEGRSSIGPGANGANDVMPEFVNTGDILTDNAIYDLKKRVWLARRPMMLGPK